MGFSKVCFVEWVAVWICEVDVLHVWERCVGMVGGTVCVDWWNAVWCGYVSLKFAGLE